MRLSADRMKISFTWCLGGLSFLLLLITVVTGALLMIYYRPTVGNAYNDILDLHYTVFLGGFLRNVHRWAGHGIVITVVLHMLRVFFTGSYKPPREFNWIVGVCLLLIILAFAFTGYLLPWDQLSYWGTRVGTSLLHSVRLFQQSLAYSGRRFFPDPNVNKTYLRAVNELIDTVHTLYTRAIVFEKSGDPEQAWGSYQKILKYVPEAQNPIFRNVSARLTDLKKRFKKKK